MSGYQEAEIYSVQTWICPTHQVYYPSNKWCPACEKRDAPLRMRHLEERINKLDERLRAIEGQSQEPPTEAKQNQG